MGTDKEKTRISRIITNSGREGGKIMDDPSVQSVNSKPNRPIFLNRRVGRARDHRYNVRHNSKRIECRYQSRG
jgi:hypothetical protein